MGGFTATASNQAIPPGVPSTKSPKKKKKNTVEKKTAVLTVKTKGSDNRKRRCRLLREDS